jgi:hypothetical protein
MLGRFDLALTAAEEGRELTRAAGDRAGEASALRSIGQTQLALGNVGIRSIEGRVLLEFGELATLQRRPAQAVS